MSSSNTIPTEKEISEVDELKKQVRDLMALVQFQATQVTQSQKESVQSSNDFESIHIPLDRMIRVISLIPYELSMVPLDNGKPKYKFTKFGDVKFILYQDLISMMEMYPHFLENGYFYIDNPDVIKRHGKTEIYSKILDKVKIDQLLECKDVNAANLYRFASVNQRRMLDEFIIGKIRDSSEDVSKLFDMNVIREISLLAGYDIVKKASEAKDILENIKEADEERRKSMK